MMYTLAQMDSSRDKKERRRIINELTARQTGIVATDYPGPMGREFIRQLHNDRPGLAITLVNKSRFCKDIPGDSMKDVATKMKGDIFDVIQTLDAPIVDIDLFGGLSIEHWKKMETAPYWEKMLITFARTFRHKKMPRGFGFEKYRGLIKPGEDPAFFVERWCIENHWKLPLMPQQPYRRPNKNAIMGLIDRRGPQYWTFLLER